MYIFSFSPSQYVFFWKKVFKNFPKNNSWIYIKIQIFYLKYKSLISRCLPNHYNDSNHLEQRLPYNNRFNFFNSQNFQKLKIQESNQETKVKINYSNICVLEYAQDIITICICDISKHCTMILYRVKGLRS